ncbi:MAG: hypothetical protein AMS26_01015 [Bacteroides sp. SM23_62]|nr:MAG: hypothetical protein AMS26_01015 [Bacteroides sp. SM23_62]
MEMILFKPFNLGKWFALGFTAFLAELLRTGRGGNFQFRFSKGDLDWDEFFELPWRIIEWLSQHPIWTAVIIVGLAIAIVLFVVLAWLSSRGMFMFLDNVVHNRSLIVKPWGEFKAIGDSLFLWRLVFSIISFIISMGFMVIAFFVARNIYLSGYGFVSYLMLILAGVLIGLLLFLVIGYISMFLNNFVVPIMYKSGLMVNDAWRIFLMLFGKHVFHFILYGFFIFGLYILVVIGIVICGLITCCCGFILLMIPYIGSVLMLPVSVTFRALSLEFLEQFGDEYKIFPTGTVDSVFTTDGNMNPVV